MAQAPTQIGRPPAPGGATPARPQAPGTNGLRPRPPVRQEMPGEYQNGTEAPVAPEAEQQLYELDEVHLDELLQHVIDSKGSDLHLAVAKAPCVRVHGIVKEITAYEKLRAPVLQRMVLRYSVGRADSAFRERTRTRLRLHHRRCRRAFSRQHL